MDPDHGGPPADQPPHDRIDPDYFPADERDHAELAGCSRDPDPLTAERYLA